MLSVVSIIVSLTGLYLKRKELMSLFQASQPKNADVAAAAATDAGEVGAAAKSVKIKEPGKEKINQITVILAASIVTKCLEDQKILPT